MKKYGVLVILVVILLVVWEIGVCIVNYLFILLMFIGILMKFWDL